MYLNKAAIGGFSASFNSFYWSSTEYASGYAWFQYFRTADQNYTYKNNTFNVRAVRAF
jgi:hypothetical protein